MLRGSIVRALPLVVTTALALSGCTVDDRPKTAEPPPTRPLQQGAKADDDQASAKLGFPSLATKNTIRVGGGDVAADAAGVANAVFPATSERSRPRAVVLVDDKDWQGGIAASVLMAPPIGAPPLVTSSGRLSSITSEVLGRLAPRGSDLAKDAQVIRIGDEVPSPPNFKAAVIQGKDPYERAAAIDRFSATAQGEPSKDVVVTSGERAEYAMPAAAWAARSGDSVLFVKRGEVPEPTRKALQEHSRPDIFLLGPKGVVDEKVEEELKKLGRVTRIQGATPVQNAIEFAKFRGRGFGWDARRPGLNLTIASTSRPLDAAAAAPLATRGTFAPLLVTDNAKTLPTSLESYLLDVQPGFEDDPNIGNYNRVWILGDESSLSLEAQGRLDELTELIKIEAESP